MPSTVNRRKEIKCRGENKKIEKINEIKSWFSANITKIDKSLACLKEKREDPNKDKIERNNKKTTEIQNSYNRILQTVVCQQCGKSRNTHPIKLKKEETDNLK